MDSDSNSYLERRQAEGLAFYEKADLPGHVREAVEVITRFETLDPSAYGTPRYSGKPHLFFPWSSRSGNWRIVRGVLDSMYAKAKENLDQMKAPERSYAELESAKGVLDDVVIDQALEGTRRQFAMRADRYVHDQGISKELWSAAKTIMHWSKREAYSDRSVFSRDGMNALFSKTSLLDRGWHVERYTVDYHYENAKGALDQHGATPGERAEVEQAKEILDAEIASQAIGIVLAREALYSQDQGMSL